MAQKTNRVNSYNISGTDITLRRGDCVLMRPAESDTPPYIARVEGLVADDGNNEMMVRVRWYYRPEDTEVGRRVFHGEKEIFLSNDYDMQSTRTIQGKCVVHTLQQYMKLKYVGVDDYFCRFEYDAGERDPHVAAGERFTPKRVTVYCKCNNPYNPDAYMVQCNTCKSWYHPSCLDLKNEDVEKLDKFFCSRVCQEDAK
ncbi:putative chromatin regulator PHD family [Helianthus anomalus]